MDVVWYRAVASSASLGTALSIVGLPAAVPLASASGCFALASSGLVVCGKKIGNKAEKTP